MSQDTELAARVRALLTDLDPPAGRREKSMFGARGFMVGDLLAVAAGPDSMVVRVPAADLPRLVTSDGVSPMAMGIRTSKTWVRVEADVVRRDAELEAWVRRGLATVAGLGAED